MKDFNTKIDDTAGAQGQVDASEYNSLFDEVKNTITVFGTALAEGDSKQMQKAMDIATKAINYEDGGTANTVQLTRPITSETTEQLFDGMVVYFTPKFANTGATTLKITTLTAKPAKYLGLDLPADFLKTDSKYYAIYDASNDWFEVDKIINKKNLDDAIGGISTIGMLTTENFIYIQDQRASSVNGGSSVAGIQTRVLNAVIENTIAGASLSSNEITLPEGTYLVEAKAPCYRGNQHKVIVYNVTDATDEIIGTSEYASSADSMQSSSFAIGKIVLASSKNISVRHYIAIADAGDGLGVASNAGVDEVYADIKIWKVD